MKSTARIVVTGLIAQYPLGGVTWDYIQYVVGLARMGHDVYYVEDTGTWPYNPHEGGIAKDANFNVGYLRDVMEAFGLQNRWAYKFPWQAQWFGLSDLDRSDILSTADLLINVSGTLANPLEYRSIKRMTYIDSDPVFTQLKIARGQEDFRRAVAAHDVQFSFGEHPAPNYPSTEFKWLPTRQPVVISEWQSMESPRDSFTTVMNWSSYKPIVFKGQTYGQKDAEFKKFMALPSRVQPLSLELALNAAGKVADAPVEALKGFGWKLVDPAIVCPTLEAYRTYILQSKGEWSVAKNGYVVGRSGWFSCRTACYLAAGRPAVVQNTGFDSVLPVGLGVVAFDDMQGAEQGIQSVVADYGRHARAASDIAHSYFDSRHVLQSLLERSFTGNQ